MQRDKKTILLRALGGFFFFGIAITLTIESEKVKEDKIRYFMWAAAGIAMGLGCVCLFAGEGENTLRKIVLFFRDFMTGIGEKIGGFFSGLFRMTPSDGKSPGMIGGYEDTKIRLSAAGRGKKKRRKKYRDMDNKERIRYIYYCLMRKKIKKGYRILLSETPSVTEKNLREEQMLGIGEDKIFSWYRQARYQDSCEITEETVTGLKKICKI